MKVRRLKAIFSLIVGISILALWGMLFSTNQIPELATEPFRISLHIFSELLLAVLLIATAVSIWKRSKSADRLFVFTMGVLLYSVINAAGYFGQSGSIGLIVIFGVLAICAVILVLVNDKDY